MIVVAWAALACASAVPEGYAYTWPVELEGEGGAYRVELGEDVYRRLVRYDLADLVAIDANGREIPFGPVPREDESRPELLRTTTVLPWFRMPRAAEASVSETVELHVVRGADGRLAPVARTTVVQPSASEDVLVDASAVPGGIDVLEVALDPASGDTSLRVDVLASDDLDAWRTPVRAQPLVALRHGGRALVRDRIELPAVDADYLLLRISGEGTGTLPVARIVAHSAQYAPGVPAPARRAIAPASAADPVERGAWRYDTGGPFPVERVALELGDANSVVHARIESRPSESVPWTPRASTTAFRIDTGEGELSSAAQDLMPVRDRYWRVIATPGTAGAPTLVLGYRPDPYLLLAQGPAPYRLAGGSHIERRAPYPLVELVDTVRASVGPSWSPMRATLGAGSPVPGAVAGPPPVEWPWLRWSLWIVLVAGAAGIVAMVAKLLRERSAAPSAPE